MTIEAAIRACDLATAAETLRSGSDVNRRGPDGQTPLMVAAGLGQAQMVELLLTAGADVLMLEPRMGSTALHKAAQSGAPDVIALLLEHGAFIDQQSPTLGNTALMDAVLHKQMDAVRVLLTLGAKTAIRNHWSQTALDLAQDGGLDAIARLIRNRDSENDEHIRQSALLFAARAGDSETVKRLIVEGASVDQRTPFTGSIDDDYTPLGIAAREGHTEIVRLLLGAGADPRRVVGLMKATPVHEAAYFGHAHVIEELTRVRDESAAPRPELDAQGSYNGLTALHDAVWHGHLDAVRVLVEAGARLDLKTHAGLTPRDLALLYGYDDIARFLQEAEQG